MDKGFEERIRLGNLYEFYGNLLTTKQKQCMEMYFLNDLSLGEIAEELQVSRQAVHDLLRRVEHTLNRYEQTLGLMQRAADEHREIARAGELLAAYATQVEQNELLTETRAIINKLIDEGR